MKVVCFKEHAVECRIRIGDEGEAHEHYRRWVVDWSEGVTTSVFDTYEDMAQYVRPVEALTRQAQEEPGAVAKLVGGCPRCGGLTRCRYDGTVNLVWCDDCDWVDELR